MKKRTIILLFFCFFLFLNVNAQSWRANADNLVVNQLFADESSFCDIFVFPQVFSSLDTVLLANGAALQVPYSNCFVYFIDLHPFANWSHPCKYVFVNALLEYSIISADNPPANDSLIGVQFRTRPNPTSSVTCTFDSIVTRNEKSENSDHLWAVLICGKENGNGSDQRFWFDLAGVYTVLTNVYGFQEPEDFYHFSDRRIIVSAPNYIRNMYKENGNVCGDLNGNNSYENTWIGDFFDYDNNGTNELTAHKKNNIQNIFECFAGTSPYQEEYAELGLRELTEEDQLFIFITGHGGHDGFGSYFYVNEGTNYNIPKIYDYDLIDWLHNIKCSQMTLMMQNCCSGGFVDLFLNDIDQGSACKNRIGQSASSDTMLSYVEGYRVYAQHYSNTNVHLANEFTYYWVSAALGYYPYYSEINNMVDKGPWNHPNSGRNVGDESMDWSLYFTGEYENNNPHSNYDVNPDTDQDGFLSFNEIFEFANNLDTWSPQGYYLPNTIGPEEDTIEFPQQRYESSFTKEAATIVGYRGQIDGIINSGTSTQPYRLCGNLWVNEGAWLNMTDDIQSPGDVSIYIKPKGRLILDGATLTNLPEERSPMWKGVQVWGNAAKHQIRENNVYWQGYLKLQNGATIQNAVVGIDVWKPNDNTTTGGIVKATDAHFLNNTMSVHFHPYENQYENPQQPGVMVVKDNVSSFKNCDFSINSNFIGPEQFHEHVGLHGVRGVSFEGCNFTFEDNSYSCPWPIGLYAYNAGFKLKEFCASNYIHPCTNPSRSTCNGFYKAVVSANDGSVGTRSTMALKTDFVNNNFGVFAVRSSFVTILNSTFSIGHDRTHCAVGIFAENTPVFTIEQDTFNLSQLYPDENYGIVIKNSKSQNLIYKNVFNGLYCANLSEGRNNTWLMPRENTDVRANILGLEYRCNENTGNFCDFYVSGGANIYMVGIQTNQGNHYAPANNTFSQGSNFQFMNHGNYGINYYHHDSYPPNSTPNSVLGVTLVPTPDTIGCPSHYEVGVSINDDDLELVLSDNQKQQREADFINAYTAYQAIKTIYDGRIDGGDTKAEIADILSATPSDMWKLRSQLLGHSPYLTEGVLTAVADKNNVFPQSVLFEILASNPDELKSDTLISYLQNMEQPFPEYMIALLRQIASGISTRTAMESEMARYVQEFRLAAGDMIRSILCDTIIDKAELVWWLGHMENMETDREIVSVYLEDGNLADAMALANMFPNLYGLTGEELVEHNDYISLLNLYGNLYNSGRNTMQLDSLERATVEHIADYSTGTPQAMAKALMMGVYGYQYEDCPSGLDLNLTNTDRGKTPNLSTEDFNKAKGFSVAVSPNPATTWVALDYTLPEGSKKAQMRTTNALNVTVATYDLTGNASQKVLDLRDLADGVYTYTVFCGKLSQTGKLVIVK